MDDLIQHLTDAYVEWFMEHLDAFLFEPPPRCVIEIPFDSADFMKEGRMTYGGKPMRRLLPSRDEAQFTARLGMGLESMPGHEEPGPV